MLVLWLVVGMVWQGVCLVSCVIVVLIEFLDCYIQLLYDIECLFLSILINMDNVYINLVKGDEIKFNDYS